MYKEQLKIYDQLVSQCPRFERKGKTMPYTSANGYMFSLLNKDGEISIRFSEEVKRKYLEQFQTTTYKSHGAIIKGYILIIDDMINQDNLVVTLLNESYDYVMSLQPK